jgi:hypothetical protein
MHNEDSAPFLMGVIAGFLAWFISDVVGYAFLASFVIVLLKEIYVNTMNEEKFGPKSLKNVTLGFAGGFSSALFIIIFELL